MDKWDKNTDFITEKVGRYGLKYHTIPVTVL